MDTGILTHIARLSDQDLVAKVKVLAQHERVATAVLIAHLAALDERRLYLAEGYSSLFAYCTQVLHLSEYGACSRIEAARAARKFPHILELLVDGSVNLTTVGLLAPHLTTENCRELLTAVRHRSKRQVEELAAGLRPLPPVPSSVRKLPPASPPRTLDLASEAGSESHSAHAGTAADHGPFLKPDGLLPPAGAPEENVVSQAPTPTPPPARRAIVQPLAPQQYKVQFTATAETYESSDLHRISCVIRSRMEMSGRLWIEPCPYSSRRWPGKSSPRRSAHGRAVNAVGPQSPRERGMNTRGRRRAMRGAAGR